MVGKEKPTEKNQIDTEAAAALFNEGNEYLKLADKADPDIMTYAKVLEVFKFTEADALNAMSDKEFSDLLQKTGMMKFATDELREISTKAAAEPNAIAEKSSDAAQAIEALKRTDTEESLYAEMAEKVFLDLFSLRRTKEE